MLWGRHPEQQASLVAQMVRNLPEMQKIQVLYPAEGNGYTLLYSCLENSMNREAWWATVHGVTKSQTQLKWLSMHALAFHSSNDHVH